MIWSMNQTYSIRLSYIKKCFLSVKIKTKSSRMQKFSISRKRKTTLPLDTWKAPLIFHYSNRCTINLLIRKVISPKSRTLQAVFRLFYFSACQPAKTEVRYDTTERRDWIRKRFCIVPAHGHPHAQRHERYREQWRGIPIPDPIRGISVSIFLWYFHWPDRASSPGTGRLETHFLSLSLSGTGGSVLLWYWWST